MRGLPYPADSDRARRRGGARGPWFDRGPFFGGYENSSDGWCFGVMIPRLKRGFQVNVNVEVERWRDPDAAVLTISPMIRGITWTTRWDEET